MKMRILVGEDSQFALTPNMFCISVFSHKEQNPNMKAFPTIELLVTFLATACATTQNIEFPQIKLTQRNQNSPFIGVSYGAGIAAVQLNYNSARSMGKWKVCIQTNVVGFIPGQLQIRKAKITQNSLTYKVDFSNMLKDVPTFAGCVNVEQALYNDMRDNSVRPRRAVPSIILTLLMRCC